MAVQQTECYRVVTIGYLKTFIGDLIQDSSNGSIKYVNLNALSAEKRRDDYCPTYSELTGGTIIQTWNPGSTPNGDRDGITVNPSAILGGNYAANQLVDQRDLSLMYTRLNSFSISANPTGVTACSTSSIISYTHTYNRNSKYMNSSCVITSGGNTAVTDTNDTEVTLTANHSCTFDGWSNHTKKLNIPKNSSSTGEAPKRDITVNGTIVFRGSTGTSTVTITQGALTGSTTYVVTTYTATTDVVAYPSTNQTFSDCGEHPWGAYGVRYYDTIERRCWIDNCGDIYPSISSDTVVSTGSTDAGTSAGTFSAVECPTTSCSNSVNVAFTADGRTSNTLVFQRSGSNSCVHCTCSAAGLGPDTQVSNTVTSSKVPVATYSSSDCSGVWKVTGLRSGTDFLDQNSIEFSNGYIYAAVGADNTSEDVRQAQYNVAIMNGSTEECSDYFTVYQQGTPPPPPGPPAPDSFYPYYPDDNYTTEDGYVRGTDNGSDRCKDRKTGVWFDFVAPLVNDYHSGSDDDSIYVDSILYLNPSTGNWENFKTAGNVYLSSDVYVYYDSHLGSYGKGAIVAIFGTNTSSDWRKLTLKMKTNDTSPISCGCNFDGRYANEWTWNFWQGPYGCSVSGKRERINPVPIGGDDPNYESHSGWSWADCD